MIGPYMGGGKLTKERLISGDNVSRHEFPPSPLNQRPFIRYHTQETSLHIPSKSAYISTSYISRLEKCCWEWLLKMDNRSLNKLYISASNSHIHPWCSLSSVRIRKIFLKTRITWYDLWKSKLTKYMYE